MLQAPPPGVICSPRLIIMDHLRVSASSVPAARGVALRGAFIQAARVGDVAIVTQCPDCGKKLKASEAQVGKKAKCPACQKPFEIKPIDGGGGGEQKVTAPNAVPQKASAPTSAPAPKRPSSAGSAVKPREDWYLQTADGEEYGPVSRSELDEWLAEGRIDNECQLLREGWEQWKWAEEIFPQLANGNGGGGANDDNPFAGLAAEQPAAGASNDYANPYESPAGNVAIAVESGLNADVNKRALVALSQSKPWLIVVVVLTSIACLFMGWLSLEIVLAMRHIFVKEMLFVFLFYLADTIAIGGLAFLLIRFLLAIGQLERKNDSSSFANAMRAQLQYWQVLAVTGVANAVAILLAYVYIRLQ